MAGGLIKVTPEQLASVAGQLNGGAGSIEGTLSQLAGNVAPLGSDWAGVAQGRFMQLWEDMSRGALGALLLVDPARLAESFPVIDLVEKYGLEYAIAVNNFDTEHRYQEDEIREALDLFPHTPVVYCAARDEGSSAQALISLVQHLLTHAA